MDFPLNLKYLNRSPLNLNRILDHLCVQIILKQFVRSIFNLPHTNSNYGHLVEAALSSNIKMVITREILGKYDDIVEMSTSAPEGELGAQIREAYEKADSEGADVLLNSSLHQAGITFIQYRRRMYMGMTADH